jgi:hypothetical protein
MQLRTGRPSSLLGNGRYDGNHHYRQHDPSRKDIEADA